MSKREYSNRDDKTYVNSHLNCCLEEATLNSLHNNIETHHNYYFFFGFLFVCSIYIFIEIWVTGMTDYLSDSIPTSFNCFIFSSKQSFLKQYNVFRKLTLYTSQKSSAKLFSLVVTLKIYNCNFSNRDDTNCGTDLNTHVTATKQKQRLFIFTVIGRFLPKTHITSLFVLFIQTMFVKLKFNNHYFAMGQAILRGITRNSFRKINEYLY